MLGLLTSLNVVFSLIVSLRYGVLLNLIYAADKCGILFLVSVFCLTDILAIESFETLGMKLAMSSSLELSHESPQ